MGAAEPALRSRVLAFAGHLAYCEGDIPAPEALLREGRMTAEQAGDAQGAGMAAHFLGNVARVRGDLAEAATCSPPATTCRHAGGLWP
jgi:hypothetical protein